MPDLRSCCQQAVLDGFTSEEHFPVCDARREDAPTTALAPTSELAPKEGEPLQ